MGNSLRCCLACVLPCGALDLVRVVHLNGRVDEYGRAVSAGEILAAHPNHVLSRPCSQGVVRRILIVSPDSELERGEIYFLIPASSVPEKKKKASRPSQRKKSRVTAQPATGKGKKPSEDDSYLSDVLSEKRPAHHHRRRCSGGRAPAWRPHLECISEDT